MTMPNLSNYKVYAQEFAVPIAGILILLAWGHLVNTKIL